MVYKIVRTFAPENETLKAMSKLLRKRLYGLPYQGSKNKIAEWILEKMPPAVMFFDLFAGGCAISHAAMTSGKYSCVYGNDIECYPFLFRDVIEGIFPDIWNYVSREGFYNIKDVLSKDDVYRAFVLSAYSFSSDLNVYYKSIEDSEKYGDEIRARYEEIIGKFGVYDFETILSRIKKREKDSLMSRNKALESVARMIELHLSMKDNHTKFVPMMNSYDEVYIPDYSNPFSGFFAVIYCDIPYRNTKKYSCMKFDYDSFYDWCEAQKHPVFISEVSIPEDRFECIAENCKRSTLSKQRNEFNYTERLFVPKCQLKMLEKYV